MSVITDTIKGIVEPISTLISEKVEDKDLVNQLNMKLNELYATSLNSAREHDKASYGIWIVDFFRGLVRPFITIAITSLYAYVKLTPDSGITWTTDDYFILGGVLAFWFGGRFLGKDIQKK